MVKPSSNFAKGIFLCFLSYLTWGLFPLFWKQLTFISPDLILAHRITWSFVFLIFLISITQQKNLKIVMTRMKNWLWLSVTGFLIGINWYTYIYAINNNQIVESSFGYYINPLVNVALGVFILKEKLNYIQKTAILFAIIGVSIMSCHIGGIPIISLVLAFSFSFYGLIRKILNIDSSAALTIETFVLLPVAVWWIFQSTNQAAISLNTLSWGLLILSGVLTAVPLLWFGKAATLIPLSVIGFMQYISPTLQLLIGIIIYKENFSFYHILSFGFVWVGLAIFSFSMIKKYRENRV